MNNFYTLIYLIREIKEKNVGSFFDFAISPHKDVLHIYLDHGGGQSRLIFSANFRETALFHDFYRPPKKSNVLEFFSILEGQRIEQVRLADKDRLVYFYFENKQHLLFKLFSGKPNVFLVENDTIMDAFKNPEEHRGETPPTPYAPEFMEKPSPRRSAKNQLLELNPLLPRPLLPYIIEQHEVEKMNVEEVTSFANQLTEALLTDPHPRVLDTGDFCLWSRKWVDRPGEKECDQINDCVAFAYKNSVHLRRLHELKEEVVRFLERTRKQKEDLVRQLNQADKSLERADEYEKYGHLLMAHAHESLSQGTEELTVPDIYEENSEVTIPLKKGKDIAANAAYYYDKAKDARKACKKARQRLPEVRKKQEAVTDLLEQLRPIKHLPEMQDWLKKRRDQLQELGYGNNDQKQAISPYRKFKVGKYEVWIGKNAKSNDQLTSLAHKEDVWLHARGVGGSHVVIRMGNQKNYPPKKVILKAASFAAFYSKARGMKSAPVMYTKRKYVRKPKGAAPGAVVVEREQVEMVPPLDPSNF